MPTWKFPDNIHRSGRFAGQAEILRIPVKAFDLSPACLPA